MLLTAYTATAAQAAWTVTLNGVDITNAVMPIDRAGVPLGNVTSLASSFGLQTGIDNQVFTVTDKSGVAWRGKNGDRTLVSSSSSLPLSAAINIEGPTAYLPLDCISALSGIAIKLSGDHTHADFGGPPATDASLDARGDGWQDLNIPKTKAELATTIADQATTVRPHIKDNLPSASDTLNIQTGLGYVQGADFGMTLTGRGKAYGDGVQFNGLVTMGPNGLGLQNATLQVSDWDRHARFEAGSLFSELWGTTAGVRLSLLGKSAATGAVSFYSGTGFGQPHGPLLAFTKEGALTRNFLLGGEIGSDGSYLLKQHFTAGGLNVYSYERSLHLGTTGSGIFGSLRLAKGFSLQGGASTDGSGIGRNDYRNVGLTFPFIKGTDMTLSRSQSITGSSRNNVTGLSFGLPINGVQFTTAFQWGDTGQQLPSFQTQLTRQQTLNLSAGYNPSPRARFDYSVSTRWNDSGGTTNWQQLVSRFQLARSTDLQVISAFPAILDTNLLKIRLERTLTSSESLSLEYGQLVPYEGVASNPTDRGFKLMYNESWSAHTPTRGGEVSGRIIDVLGHPVSNAVIHLGAYSVTADTSGRYRIKDVPTGTYRLYVDEGSLPANYRQTAENESVAIDSGTNKVTNFTVTPQGTVCGRVYCDKNADGLYEPGEGFPNAVVRLGKTVVATDADGMYAFYNIDPGYVMVELDAAHLTNGYVPNSLTKYQPELKAGQSLTGLDFAIVFKDKDVVYQDAL